MRLRLQAAFPALLLAVCSVPVCAQFEAHTTAMQVINGRPYVQVFINHQGPFRFLVDTGTSAEAIVTPALAEELHLPQTGSLVLHDPTGLLGPTVPVRLVDTLTIAGMDFYAVRAAEHTLLTTDVFCDGLLGFKLFDGTLLTLDYPGQRMVLRDGALQPDGGRHVQPFNRRDGLPFIPLAMGGVQVEALIDSGGTGLSIPSGYAKELGVSGDSNLMGTERTLVAIFPFRVVQLESDVRMGAVSFERPWVEINSTFQYANLGSEALRHFAITFDQDNDLVRFDGPIERVPVGIAPSAPRWGTAMLFATPAGVTRAP